jgi:hypothetical protein
MDRVYAIYFDLSNQINSGAQPARAASLGGLWGQTTYGDGMAEVRVARPEAGDRPSRAWLVTVAAAGFVAKGLMYIAVGALAARAAFGVDEPTGTRGVADRMREHPLGFVLMLAIAVGLLGYAVWRIVRAATDSEDDTMWKRLAGFGTAAVHLFILVGVVQVLLGWSASQDDQSTEHWTARVLAQPYGRWLVVAVGVGLVVRGLSQMYKAAINKLDDELDFAAMEKPARRVIPWVARGGMLARAVVFVVGGSSLASAGVQLDPQNADGVPGILSGIGDAPFGQWLLATVAVGFVAYGLYQLVLARYRTVPTG